MSKNALTKPITALEHIKQNAEAIYSVLDAGRGPVKVDQIRAELGLGEHEFRVAKRHLMMATEEVYCTQDGLILRKYLQDEDERRFWHLAWSLGLLEVTGQQLTMDTDMLEKAPATLMQLWNEGKLSDYKRLSKLQTLAKKRIVTLLKLVDMYRQVEKSLQMALLPYIATNDWKGGMREIKKQLKRVS